MKFAMNEKVCWLAAVCFSALMFTAPAIADEGFELKDGDRVAWIGSEFTEQATKHNFVEAALTARWPDRRITFRNLGWAGDNPTAVARGYFGGAEEGYKRLQEELVRIKPTIIFLEYGETSAYAGKAGLPKFQEEMKRLIGDLRKITDRIVIVSPPPAEKLGGRLADPAAVNQNRQEYTAALKSLAEAEKFRFVDIFTPLSEELARPEARQLTTDTLRYNKTGYAAAAEATLNSLGVSGFTRDGANDELRELIRAKNDLYFHQYRPQNETYLRGFRKHEQGQNAKEIAEFDPLIAHAESRIAAYVQGKPLPAALPEPPPKELDFKALTPEEQKAKFKLADGLEISVFAAEPLLANPIHMNFDSKGRLWVATSPIYPQIQPGAVPKDEIVILEDTDGDNVADKRTVFANDLLIPTAVLPDEQGGAYVANSTELVHLSDTDGDGKADTRKVILSGFGTEDTHHILHTFRWSPDALLSFNQSIYIHSQVETPYGVQSMLGSGIWRYRPETARANTVAFGLVNPWGYIFDNWGQSFATDGAGGEGINYIFPGAAYLTAVGYDRILRGMNPGQPKFCGLEIITGQHFSEDYQNTLVTADFRGNRVCRFRLSEENSGYVSRQLDDVLTCEDRAFRPVDQKIGLDGTLFIADWHNPIINHGEVDFRDARRDDRHGRIWRVSQTGRKPTPKPAFENTSIEQLLQLLTVPEQWTRQMARVHLRYRDAKQVAAAVDKWVTALDPKNPQFELLRLEALWTYQALGNVPEALLKALLKSEDHHVRAAAVRVLSQVTQEDYGLPADFAVLPLLETAVADAHPQVRLEAINALRQVPDAHSLAIAVRALNQPTDTSIDYALWLTARKLEPYWQQQVVDGNAEFSSDIPKLLYVLKASDKAFAVAPLMKLLLADKVPADQLGDVLAIIGKFSGQAEAQQLFARALTKPEEQGHLLNTLVSMAEKRGISHGGEVPALEGLLQHPQAIYLAGLWQQTALQPKVVAIAEDNAADLAKREAAIRGLRALKAREVLDKLASSSDFPLTIQRRAIAEVQALDTPAGAKAAAALLLRSKPEDEPELNGLMDAILAPKEGPNQLADALKEVKLPEIAAAVVVRKAESLGARGQRLVQTVRGTTPPATPPKVWTPEEVAGLLAQVQTHGNAARGELIFRRKESTCLSCHSIGGAGGQAGPDMLSLGASSPVDYIMESLLNPSAKIKEGYHTNTIALEDGKILSGIMVREGDTEIVIRDAQNKEITIPKSEIDERSISTASLMPADLMSKLSRDELLDLVVFLSSLGKEGPYKVPQNRFIRRWLTEDQVQLFSRVDGMLPIEELPGGKVSFDVDVTTAGLIGLKFRDSDGLTITRFDKQETLQGGMLLVDLPVGRQRFQIEIPAGRTSPLQVEVIDAENSPGRAAPGNR